MLLYSAGYWLAQDSGQKEFQAHWGRYGIDEVLIHRNNGYSLCK